MQVALVDWSYRSHRSPFRSETWIGYESASASGETCQ
jgi:hypothetical protein